MTKEREGEILVVTLSLLEGLFPILSLFSIAFIGALYTYAFVLVISTMILGILLLFQRKMHELFIGGAQKELLLTAFYITLLFTLIFLSLRYTTAGNVAVLLFMQLLFSYLYFNLFGKEALTAKHTYGAALMGVGAIIILLPDNLRFNLGDALALGAAAIAPIANLYQKRARSYVSTITILTYRNLVAIPFLFVMAYFFESALTYEQFANAMPYLIAIAILVYVLAKIFWVEALHRISITKMSAMIALIPLFTLIFAYFILNEVPSPRQLAGIIPVLLGGYLITRPSL